MTIQIPASISSSNINIDQETYDKLSGILLSNKSPLALRFRALFSLKAVNTEQSINIISSAFKDDSCLLKHEVAYVLGQMKNPKGLEALKNILSDHSQEAMVRHEAAEAMGVILSCNAPDEESLALLRDCKSDMFAVVRETAELALDLIAHSANKTKDSNSYECVDPAPAFEKSDKLKVEELENILLDTELPLFKRYRAMFSLRDIGTDEAISALSKGFYDNSALFRHEIAFVFGQMQNPASIPALIQVLENTSELSMVRHESAEALGSIATKECYEVLQTFSTDADRTVRESCLVGLDMYEYETGSELKFI